jgi:predicted flap endonuclease-1-like 5' DNA nuclease
MSWLALQIWIELLLAAGLGGVAAWAYLKWRPSFGVLPGRVSAFAAVSAAGVTDPEGRVRIAELEAQVRVEREETEALRRKLAAGSANVMTPRAKPVSDEAPAGPAEGEGALAWRNRFLESKVRFLEGKLADAEEAMASQLPPPDENDEATRLRWRNRYLEGRVKYLEEELTTGGTLQVAMPSDVLASTAVAAKASPSEADKPDLLEAARYNRADDLKAISGIGPKLERLLNSIGVYHYDQVASWTPRQVDWVNAAISFRGRIERERWVAQAAQLLHADANGKRQFGEGSGD